jgi:hypothetical protein
MHKNATKCNKTQSKWYINKHGASKITDTLETYHSSIGHCWEHRRLPLAALPPAARSTAARRLLLCHLLWLAALPPTAGSTAHRRSLPLGASPAARSPLRAPPWRALQHHHSELHYGCPCSDEIKRCGSDVPCSSRWGRAVQRGWGHGTWGASRRKMGEKGERGMKRDEEEDTGKRREDKAVEWASLAVFHVPWTCGALTRRRTRRALSPARTQSFSKKKHTGDPIAPLPLRSPF